MTAAAIASGVGASNAEEQAGRTGAVERPPLVFRAATSLLLLTPIRLALAVGGLGGALAVADTSAAAVFVAFAAGGLATAILLAADPRFSRDRLREIFQLPPNAVVMSRGRTTLYGATPSTIGVAVLTGIALFFNAVLAALLAGIQAGMGIMGFASWLYLDAIERRERYRLYVQHGGRRVFAGPR